jgi:hypothetical protein
MSDERRWSGMAWLTVAFALAILLLQGADAVFSLPFPSDGWNYDSTADLRNRVRFYTLDTPTPLRPDDRVIAIDGRPWDPTLTPPVPETVFAGQTLRYTLQRGDQRLDVAVTLNSRPYRSVLIGLAETARRDPFGIVIYLFSLAIAVAVFVLRPGNLAARYMLIVFSILVASLLGLGGSLGPYVWRAPGVFIAKQAFDGSAWSMVFFPSLTLLALSFPRVKAPLRRMPQLLPTLFYGVPSALATQGIVRAVTERDLLATSSPLAFMSFAVALLCFVVVLIASLAHGFAKEKDPVARAQLRWAAVGLGGSYGVLVVAFAMTAALGIDAVERNRILDITGTSLILFPVCLAIAILRYRLFDINVILRRTVTYAIVSGALAIVYFGVNVIAQGVIGALGGQRNEVAIVISTLAVAALFSPVRRRVQEAIDRRFNRQRYDADKVIADFAEYAAHETDLAALQASIVGVVAETIQPRQVTVWVRGIESSSESGDREARATDRKLDSLR